MCMFKRVWEHGLLYLCLVWQISPLCNRIQKTVTSLTHLHHRGRSGAHWRAGTSWGLNLCLGRTRDGGVRRSSGPPPPLCSGTQSLVAPARRRWGSRSTRSWWGTQFHWCLDPQWWHRHTGPHLPGTRGCGSQSTWLPLGGSPCRKRTHNSWMGKRHIAEY